MTENHFTVRPHAAPCHKLSFGERRRAYEKHIDEVDARIIAESRDKLDRGEITLIPLEEVLREHNALDLLDRQDSAG